VCNGHWQAGSNGGVLGEEKFNPVEREVFLRITNGELRVAVIRRIRQKLDRRRTLSALIKINYEN